LIVAMALAGCDATPTDIQTAIGSAAPTRAAAADETHETSAAGPHAPHAAAECDPADVPAPSSGVMVRFVNGSGGEMILERIAGDATPPRLDEVARLPDGGHHDQVTAAGDAWLMKEIRPDGAIYTLEYVASAEAQQCATFHHWTYEGEGEPAHWAELREEFGQCALGHHQSPIPLSGDAAAADLADVDLAYGPTAVNMLNNGHTIQVDQVVDNRMILDGEPYQLLQFHFHAPSEHVVDGRSYPLEMHLVHRNESGELAVVGVFIAEGAANSAFDPVWAHLPAAETDGAIPTGATVDVAALLPAERAHYHYNGSLTTPPCSENVSWMVMKTPVEMSAAQIAAFTAIMDGNNRPLQELDEHNPQLDETP